MSERTIEWTPIWAPGPRGGILRWQALEYTADGRVCWPVGIPPSVIKVAHPRLGTMYKPFGIPEIFTDLEKAKALAVVAARLD